MLEVKTYKNWKELCNAMDWSNKGGNTKKKYLKQLESICKYHKDGNSFVIDEIYENPKPIEDNRGGKRQYKSKYTKVRINKNDLDKAIELLKDNGIDFKL